MSIIIKSTNFGKNLFGGYNVLENVKGMLNGMIVVDTVTIYPKQAKLLNDYLQKEGAILLESKIECYPSQVGTEDAYLVYSGNIDTFDFIKKDLASLSPKPAYIGDSIKNASVMDMILVQYQHIGMLNSIICTAMALKNGSPIELVKDTLEVANYQTPFVSQSEIYTPLKSGLASDYGKAVGANMECQMHSLKMVTKVLEDAGIDTTINKKLEALVENVIAEGKGKNGYVEIINHLLREK